MHKDVFVVEFSEVANNVDNRKAIIRARLFTVRVPRERHHTSYPRTLISNVFLDDGPANVEFLS